MSDSATRQAEFLSYLGEARGRAERRGTPGHLDPARTLAAAASIRTGETISIARPIPEGTGSQPARDGQPVLSIIRHENDWGRITSIVDRMSVWCHSAEFTHIDAVDHVLFDGGGFPDFAGAPLWSDTGIATRAVLLDVPAFRKVDYVTPDQPVTAAELDRIVAVTGEAPEPGDAVLLYCGRDKLEAGQTEFRPPDPVVGQDVATWLDQRQAALLCWDIGDAPQADRLDEGPHLLLWATGLAIIDGCDYSRAVPALRAAGRSSAFLAVAPLPLAGATGCLINPLLIL